MLSKWLKSHRGKKPKPCIRDKKIWDQITQQVLLFQSSQNSFKQDDKAQKDWGRSENISKRRRRWIERVGKCVWERQTDTETHRERQRDRDTDTLTDTHTERNRERAERQAERQKRNELLQWLTGFFFLLQNKCHSLNISNPGSTWKHEQQNMFA